MDDAREAEIRTASLQLLAEVGYDRLTFDAVAARARASKATLYRRWPHKGELVADCLAAWAPAACTLPDLPLPDTGDLAADLRAEIHQSLTAGAEPGVETRLLCSLSTAMIHDQELAAAVRQRFLQPRLTRFETIVRRAQQRGQVDGDIDVGLVVQVLPAMAVFHLSAEPCPDLVAHLLAVVDRVVLPALQRPRQDPGGRAGPAPT